MTSPTLVGVSLKMYFGHAQTVDWITRVAALASAHPAVIDGSVQLFVIPSFVSIVPSIAAADGSRIIVGAQDIASADSGAFTGEVSGAELAEVGVGVVEVGHAERRSLFGETDDIVAAKTAAALRNGITPVLCIGETSKGDPADAAAECIRQLRSALDAAGTGPVIVAYEPVWAIGAERPAEPEYVRAVCRALREEIAGRAGSSVIYGGSAGPGLLSELGDDVDGIFLGRFAHNTDALATVLDEAGARS